MSDRRYRLDADAQRHGRALIAGSPLKLFRLTDAGALVVDRIEAGEAVRPSMLVDALEDAGAIHPLPDRPAPYTAADVTIVVPVHGPAHEAPDGAIVVDDGSDPPIEGATIRLDVNRGPAAARNAGLDRVHTELVAFVDADVVLPEGWLDPLLPHFDDDRVALVAPRVTSAPGRTVLERYELVHSPLDLGDRPARVRAGSRVSYVPTAAVVARVEALREVGGFDTGLRVGEDVDLVWRLERAGRRVRYEPSSVVTHAPRPTWCRWIEQRVRYGSSAAPLARRHPGALAPIRMSGWSVSTWTAGVLAHPVIGIGIGVGSAAALVGKLRDVPPRAAFLLAWRGNLHAGSQLAAAIRRTWWPLLLLIGLRSRRARRALFVAALAAGDPIRLVDDVAYSVGVWRGVMAERTIAPLVPEISSWPGRRSTAPSSDAR